VYFQAIRARIFERYSLPAVHKLTKRIYISRRGAKHRRVINEVALLELLSEYGFESVDLESLPFRRQVELFHQCEILIAPHGAGVCTSMFSGPITMIVLYATQSPPNYFHSQAKGLGQKHLYVCGKSECEDDDFAVDLIEVRRKLDRILGCRA
jgi:capsular polysaccharide biosynthesis protein